MNASFSKAAVAALLLLGLWGCGEEPGVALHEPGVYKGPEDPLLEKSTSENLDEQLRQRFMMVQTDR
ncbi:MAG: hypothetical protein ACFCBW_12605 [Candidatus Competibacterales bacterium]